LLGFGIPAKIVITFLGFLIPFLFSDDGKGFRIVQKVSRQKM